MSDDRSRAGNPGRQRVDVGEAHALRDRVPKRDVSRQQVRDAVAKVGKAASGVERELGKRKRRPSRETNA